jgi:hypothetical protein
MLVALSPAAIHSHSGKIDTTDPFPAIEGTLRTAHTVSDIETVTFEKIR